MTGMGRMEEDVGSLRERKGAMRDINVAVGWR